ncbi:hypothetical protein [Pseudochrobactrum asaccharolyticum]|uniref:hypothetical protein n=1 Tax=Pseudochrobactrum asaccharolyticum TaxID=354351 RepID=UPI0040422594
MTQHKLFRPIIGVTLDSEEGGGFSDSPWYAIRQNYLSCLEEAGGGADCAAASGRTGRELSEYD